MNAALSIGIAVLGLAGTAALGAWLLTFVADGDEKRIRSHLRRRHPGVEIVSIEYLSRSEDGTRLGNVSGTYGRCYRVVTRKDGDTAVMEANVFGWAVSCAVR